MTAEEFWRRFLRETGRGEDTRFSEVFAFAEGETADKLAGLTLAGRKRATTSCLEAYCAEGEALPEKGELSVVTDGKGEPKCVIETTEVTVLPFGEVTWEICRREGEDERLETWRETHRRIFTEEGRRLGYDFTDETRVVFEDFRVIYPSVYELWNIWRL